MNEGKHISNVDDETMKATLPKRMILYHKVAKYQNKKKKLFIQHS